MSEDNVVEIVKDAYGKRKGIKARGKAGPAKAPKGQKTQVKRGKLMDRIEGLEGAMKEMYESNVLAASAINRSEHFVFGMLKSMIDSGHITLERLVEYMDELDKHKSLDTYWDCVPGEGDAEMDEVLLSKECDDCEDEGCECEVGPDEIVTSEEEDDSSADA
jgi:hypothetical protein